MAEPGTGEVSLAVAGLEPPLVQRAWGRGRTVEAVTAGGMPLGVRPDREQEGGEAGGARVLLAPGDRLLLYTDGLTEARFPGRPSGIFATEGAMEALGAVAAASLWASHVPAYLAARAAAEAGGSRRDDVCLLLLCRDTSGTALTGNPDSRFLSCFPNAAVRNKSA